jgi:hypothetical protein
MIILNTHNLIQFHGRLAFFYICFLLHNLVQSHRRLALARDEIMREHKSTSRHELCAHIHRPG